jgi:Peptidase S24-like
MTPGTRECLKLDLVVETLQTRGTVNLKAWGSSMLPSVWPGDLLTIQHAAGDDVIPGDIVLLLRDHRFFIHRLVEKRLNQNVPSWITKGDAARHNDPPANELSTDLLGRVAAIRRGDRSFVPNRRISLVHSTMAWIFCRSARFRSLALRIHVAQIEAQPKHGDEFAHNESSAPSVLGALLSPTSQL